MASSTALPSLINRPNLVPHIAKYTANSKYPTDLAIGTLTPFRLLTRGSMDRTSNAMINGTTNIRPYLREHPPESKFRGRFSTITARPGFLRSTPAHVPFPKPH